MNLSNAKILIVETVKERNNPNAKLKTVSMETKEILQELERDYKPASDTKSKEKAKADKFNAVSWILIQFQETLTSNLNIIISFHLIIRHIIQRELQQQVLHQQ